MVDNDTRGWILASVSGVACIFGACIICIDYLVRLFPGKEKFEIKKSSTFLSSSLSLSFGVMLFSALYNMLPEAKNSLMDGGFSRRAASYTLIACFLGGVIGIQLLSRLFHHFIPSHAVGCEPHDENDHVDQGHDHEHEDGHGHGYGLGIDQQRHGTSLDGSAYDHLKRSANRPNGGLVKMASETDALLGSSKRPAPLRTRVSGFLTGAESECDDQGSCHGFTDPCGKESFTVKTHPNTSASSSPVASTFKAARSPGRSMTASLGALPENRKPLDDSLHQADGGSDHTADGSASGSTAAASPRPGSPDIEQGNPEPHHHHVPDNAFLSIGVQTSVAIALHKLPEGFITYATNHANPQLGFSIFVALFIHNITEGFALALPLFLAINSRWKAIVAAAVLGGASQPLGAGIAVLWLRAANQRGVQPDEKVYGCMFAITSGIMTSVALQLFSESLGMTHNKTRCIAWAFIGMGVLGLSSALTA